MVQACNGEEIEMMRATSPCHAVERAAIPSASIRSPVDLTIFERRKDTQFMRESNPPSVPFSNADVEWDRFNSAEYFEQNYGRLREDDQQIIRVVGDFFAGATRGELVGEAIDVGAGTNLYPALTMLPYSARVTLLERAHSNRRWLQRELVEPHKSWLEFWNEAALDRPPYHPIADPLDVLQQRAKVSRGNVLTLDEDRYDIGTMFFVAESITTRTDEFRRAVRQFVRSLRQGAPFAAAFMRESSGYSVGDQRFPACPIEEKDVKVALATVARKVNISVVASDDLRDGYSGMMVATGFKR
jgi:hypothetical protein